MAAWQTQMPQRRMRNPHRSEYEHSKCILRYLFFSCQSSAAPELKHRVAVNAKWGSGVWCEEISSLERHLEKEVSLLERASTFREDRMVTHRIAENRCGAKGREEARIVRYLQTRLYIQLGKLGPCTSPGELFSGRRSQIRPDSQGASSSFFNTQGASSPFFNSRCSLHAMQDTFASWTQWAANAASTRTAQLTATAVVSSSLAIGSLIAYQSAVHAERVRRVKASIPKQLERIQLDPLLANVASGQLSSTHRSEVVDRRNVSAEQLKQDTTSTASKEDERATFLARRAQRGDYDEELILEQLARNRVFLQDDGLERVRNAFVIVVGCGGVGSHCAAALARSGVSRIRLIDFDQVTLSSLNRHSVATLADVGTPKVDCLRKRLEQIAPWVQFDCRKELFKADAAEDQLRPWRQGEQEQAPAWIVDAIDNIDSKVDLLRHCSLHHLPVISSMGAGCKSDPTALFIGDISSSLEDPLSRSTRRRLRMQGIASGIPSVYSAEKMSPAKASLQPLPDEIFNAMSGAGGVDGASVGDLSVLPAFRVRILPVLGTMPAMFGLCLANHILLSLAGYPANYRTAKGRERLYDAVLAGLQASEERLARKSGVDTVGLRVPLSATDVAYLVEEVFRGRSVVTGLTSRLALVRWRMLSIPKSGEAASTRVANVRMDISGQRCSVLNMEELVCMTKEEAARHEEKVLLGGQDPREVYEQDVLKRIEELREEERAYSRFR